MAGAVTFAGATWNTTAGTHTVTATPAVGDLIVIACANAAITAAPTVTDDNSSGAYTNVASALHASSTETMFFFVRTALIPAANSTIFTCTGVSSSGGGLFVSRVSGMTLTGASAVRQSGKQENQGAGTPAPAFPLPADANNVLLGAVMTSTNGTTNTAPPTSPNWTEDSDLGFNVPATGFEVCHIDSGDTRTTLTFSGATPSVFASLIIELNTTGALSPYLATQIVAAP